MLPEFGCRLRRLLFEPITEATTVLAKTYVTDAISRWEKRVKLLNAQVLYVTEESRFSVRMNYLYTETSEVKTSVFSVGREGVTIQNGRSTTS